LMDKCKIDLVSLLKAQIWNEICNIL
jgi:hypothetical protein